MKIAIITAGGAGMFCGSCMQDNTLARTLRLAGEDAILVPTYTPIRVDEDDVSADRVFMGGVNVYLDSKLPGWGRLPRWMTQWLDRPNMIRRLTRLGGDTEASKLGALTLDMLQGTAGPQRREVVELVDYLCNNLRPDVILFSNALLSGVLSELRPRFSGKILCLLQGDDVFLDGLSSRWKAPVFTQLRQNCQAFDGFLTHSRYYSEFMSEYLQLPDQKFRRIPLTIDVSDHPALLSAAADNTNDEETARPFRVGYFARVCPEKGAQNLLAAATEILPDLPHAEIAIAGYLPDQHRRWFHRLLQKAQQRLPNRIHWLGSPDERPDKFRIISSFDVLCVPTEYNEPKGLYVLEAGLCGVPALLPAHGAFPEMIAAVKHGATYDRADTTGLSLALRSVVSAGRQPASDLPDRVKERFGMAATGPSLVEAITSM
ncbi:MAG: glycosyltransferase family 4 protein [Fuerstiella sp.]|nr:glycosyltransferase family 4 protein [Fuerstiella sp.]MCP4858486.1 glycosyltransferase family 4 protein [Fuerstiella sp.]